MKISKESLGRAADAVLKSYLAHGGAFNSAQLAQLAEAAVLAALEPDVKVSVPTNQRFPILSMGDKYPESHTYALVREAVE